MGGGGVILDIQKICSIIGMIDSYSDDFSSHNWNAWMELSTSKCFLNWILATKLQLMKRVSERLDIKSESFEKEYIYLLGQIETISLIVEKLNELVSDEFKEPKNSTKKDRESEY